MNHEYVLFSKNTCQNSMVNVLDKDKILWYVMRAYKNENTAEDRLSKLKNPPTFVRYIFLCNFVIVMRQ